MIFYALITLNLILFALNLYVLLINVRGVKLNREMKLKLLRATLSLQKDLRRFNDT